MKHRVVLLAIAIALPLWCADIEYEKAVRSAEEFLSAGRFEEAIERLMPWTRDQAARPEAHRVIGLALYSVKNFQPAILHLQTALKLESPASAAGLEAAEVLGVAHYLNGSPRDALPWLELAVSKANPVDSKLLYTLGMCQLQSGHIDKAVATFGKLYGVDGGSPKANLVTAIHLLSLGLHQDAAPLLERARRLDPELPDLAYRLGIVALGKADYSGAQKLFEEEVRRSPASAHAWHSLGEARFSLANMRLAEEAFQRAIWLNDRHAPSYLFLSRIFMESERMALAEDTLKRVIEIDSQNADAHFLYARLCHKTGRPQLARELMDTATRLKQKSKP